MTKSDRKIPKLVYEIGKNKFKQNVRTSNHFDNYLKSYYDLSVKNT